MSLMRENQNSVRIQVSDEEYLLKLKNSSLEDFIFLINRNGILSWEEVKYKVAVE